MPPTNYVRPKRQNCGLTKCKKVIICLFLKREKKIKVNKVQRKLNYIYLNIKKLCLNVNVHRYKSYIRHEDFRLSSVRSSFVTLRPPPLDSETGWTGELWSKTKFLILEN